MKRETFEQTQVERKRFNAIPWIIAAIIALVAVVFLQEFLEERGERADPEIVPAENGADIEQVTPEQLPPPQPDNR